MDPLEHIRLVIEELYQGLDVLPYHVFLGVTPDTQGDPLRDAFHRRAREFHPDLFYELDDPAFRKKVYAVYKRITEAYRVLSHPEQRRRYEAQRKQGATRFDPSRDVGARRPEHITISPAARKYWNLGLDAERRGDVRSARLNFQLALQLDPDNAALKERLAKLK